jgi:hypothetical protein
MIVLADTHLRRVMKAYADGYNNTCTHFSLAMDAPIERKIMRSGTIKSIPHMGGSHHQYVQT